MSILRGAIVVFFCGTLVSSTHEPVQASVVRLVTGNVVQIDPDDFHGVTFTNNLPGPWNQTASTIYPVPVPNGGSFGVGSQESDLDEFGGSASGNGLVSARTGSANPFQFGAAESSFTTQINAPETIQVAYSYALNNSFPLAGPPFFGPTSYGYSKFKLGTLIDVQLNATGNLADSGMVSLSPGSYDLEAKAYVATFNGTATPTSLAQWIFSLQIYDGNSQANPYRPDFMGPWTFVNKPSHKWFDPPIVDAFEFQTLSASDFTSLTLPVGLGDPDGYDIYDGSNVLLQAGVAGGDSYSLPAGTTHFFIRGISPAVDSANTLAFPVLLEFSTPTASFTMIAVVPEPSSIVLLSVGACIALLHGRRWIRPAKIG